MARVARGVPGNGGERYQRDPDPRGPGRWDRSRDPPSCPSSVDTGGGPAVSQRPGVGADREGSEPVRRTAAVVAGALLLRSEEHTSELQSRQYLVCRLLLEKKKTSITASLHLIPVN